MYKFKQVFYVISLVALFSSIAYAADTFFRELQVDDVNVNGSTIKNNSANRNLYLDANGTGSVIIGKLLVTGEATLGSSLALSSNLTTNGNLQVDGTMTTGGSATISGSLTANGLSYPTTDGTANQVILTDGSGTLTFEDVPDPSGFVSSSSTLGAKLVSARVDGTSNSVVSQDGAWIDSFTDNGVGRHQLNVATGTFDNVPHCVATPYSNGAGNAFAHINTNDGAISTSTIQVGCDDQSGADADCVFFIVCVERE